jgi:hypothetical protein
MSAESRRDWLMTHPTLGVAIMTTAITAFAVPFAIVTLASSGANGALGAAGVCIGLGWLAGFVYGNVLIRRQGAGRDWRPPEPSEAKDAGGPE